MLSSLVTSWILAKFTSVTKSIVVADRAVGPQAGAAHVRAVLQEKGQVLRLVIPGVVEIESAAEVEAECLVRAFQHGTIVPIGVQARSRVGIGRILSRGGPRDATSAKILPDCSRRACGRGHSGPQPGRRAVGSPRDRPATRSPAWLRRPILSPGDLLPLGRRSEAMSKRPSNAGNNQCSDDAQDHSPGLKGAV